MINAQMRARLAAAEADELIEMLVHSSLEETSQLRTYLGPEAFQRMRSLALRKITRQREVRDLSQGNVLFVPALLHNELSLKENRRLTPIWLSARSVADGQLQLLRLDGSGLAEANRQKQISVSGLMKRYCGELLLTLAQNWRVRTFTYDWRKSLRLAATQLQAHIEANFPAGEPVHMVALGAGGIVARLYIALYGERWKQRGGLLLTIGAPHLGTPIYLQALAGHLNIVQWADKLDPHYNRDEYLSLVHTFPSIYQLLPFGQDGDVDLLQANVYGSLNTIRQEHLDSAGEVQQLLRAAVDPERMLAVVGYGRPSHAGVKLPEFQKALLRSHSADKAGLDALYTAEQGDGDVAISRAELRTDAGALIPTLYADVSSHPLIHAPSLLRALDDLLQARDLSAATLQTIGIRHDLKTTFETSASESLAAGDLLSTKTEDESQQVEQLVRRLKRTIATVGANESTEHELTLEGFLMRHLGTVRRDQSRVEDSFEPPSIFIEAILGDISKIDQLEAPLPAGIPVDAIAVGHYLGGTAQSSLAALDQAISPFVMDKTGAAPRENTLSILEDLLQRGTIRGELANLFLLPDPRPEGVADQRMIAVGGMGVAGRFGVPELTILVRELCWTLGRIGKKHLATVLIGAGQNNLSAAEAAEAWVRGIKLAITGARSDQLEQITFVEFSPQRLVILDRRLQQLATELGNRRRMTILHTPLDSLERQTIREEALAQLTREMNRQLDAVFDEQKSSSGREVPAIRIAVEYDGENYRFGAITQEAAVPDREIPLDARIVSQANNRLASVSALDEQMQQGEFLARFLFPDDFHANLSGGVPVVLTLDTNAARIHWELLCLSEQQLLGRRAPATDEGARSEMDLFLGTACGLTRQLRTPFARAPEPQPQHNRLLRVLVVADPAADARLPGAEEEGNAVADLLELYNLLTTTKNRIEVVRLIGPVEATRVSVLQHLMTRSYDVLHFAGHCVYDTEQPRSSGWIFTDDERLTAREIQRIDRVPGLVISNACESGVTPERAEKRSAALAPTFAETFFARGVANFVCTAWPVGDREARDFALSLYADLIGLKFAPQASQRPLRTDSRHYQIDKPQPFHIAMRNARRAIADLPYDRHSWGAYQHYGNPYARLFAPDST
jgi:hypothetical protein